MSLKINPSSKIQGIDVTVLVMLSGKNGAKTLKNMLTKHLTDQHFLIHFLTKKVDRDIDRQNNLNTVQSLDMHETDKEKWSFHPPF